MKTLNGFHPEVAGASAAARDPASRGASVDLNFTVAELFEQQAARVPDAIALLGGDARLTYRELNERANRLAHYLRARGVSVETPVGVCLRRSLDTVVALLAVVKAGGAYVPLDPDYPAERLAFMLEDTRAPVLIADRTCAAALPAHRAELILIDAEARAIAAQSSTDPDTHICPVNLIYIMYTSGSTGRPKGVMIEHRAVVRLVKDSGYVSFDESQRFLLLAPISFDASTLEIWGPLLNGASLVVMPPETPSLERVGEVISRFQVTTLWLTAGLFNLMIDQHPRALAPLRQLLSGGDAGSPAHFRKALAALPDCRMINGYGPTESTTFAVCMTVRPEDLSSTSVPIGYPIANTQVWLLDDELNPVSEGEIGELCIGGDGLARGYLNRPELTAEKFVVPRWSADPALRLYRTGDLARRRADGAIECLGRIDDQVKISGYRVEPGEVAAALREFSPVRDAVVLAEESPRGDKQLTAYVVPRSRPAPDPAEFRAFLSRKLPHYMVPAAFVTLDAIPLTSNGKVDREALLRRRGEAPSPGGQTTPLHGSLAAAISAIWREVLGLEQVGARDNFFDLGGDSLKLIEVHSRLRKQLDRKLSLVDLFEFPTIEALVERLEGQTNARPVGDDLELRARRQKELLARRARPEVS
jgi:amino acid adenylation domain-containing protein